MEQMKIEILKPSNMVQKGSALRRLLMNDHTPVMDLLVRESIQNSLDAAAHKDNTSYPVSVHFRVGSFDNVRLNNSLEGVTEKLNRRFPNNGTEYKYLSITDKGTQGLTGKMNIEDVTDDNAGNLINLVYDICKPQDNEGSGGSWGIGKTVYFRIGIGLVIYYSRVLNPQTNKCESRLVASLVEDEKLSNAVIPQYEHFPKYGIAWWGEELRENKTLPITDENYIREFLTIFGIPEFKGVNDIGTTIIIPYINESMLLKNNANEWDDYCKGFSPYWMKSMEEYLRVAVQRWYFPRLDNRYNQNAKRLKVKINDSVVESDSFLPIFKLEQALYNRASGGKDCGDYLLGYDVKTENIRINSVLEEPLAGCVSFVKVNKKVVGMCPPDNELHPNINFNIPIKDPTKNDAVIAYCRKPGMIVSYDQDLWARNVPSCSSEDFILAVFVLNSQNRLTSGISLEEYIRKGEHADHSSWNDSCIDGTNPIIVSRIQTRVSKKLSEVFSEEDDNSPRKNSGLGKFLGDMILPPIGFGSQSTNRPKGESSGGASSKSNVKYKLENVDYNGDLVSINYKVSAAFDAKEFGFTALLSSESTSITFDTWEQELGLDLPFHIVSQNVKINKIDKEKCYNTYIIKKTDCESDDLLDVIRVDSSKGSCCGLKVVFREKHAFDASVTINMVLKKRDVRPIIKTL